MDLFNCIALLCLIQLQILQTIKAEIYNRDPFDSEKNTVIKVNKCCEEDELYIGNYCTRPISRNQTLWTPVFTTQNGKPINTLINYKLVTGLPDCGPMQRWPIYHYRNSTDRLRLLPDGVLRHFFDHSTSNDDEFFEIENRNGENSLYYDYEPGKYCLEKRVDDGNFMSVYAWVCAPSHHLQWTTTEFLMRNVVSPITHGIGIICFLIVAIIYFVMPTLRDLVGNIVTTICVCLIVNQATDLIRLLTILNSHLSLIITETFCYISLLGAFFWLNSLGYYIWKTFKSRNVFLRITDGKKYCYYSSYAWSCTIVLGLLAVFAHFTLDYPQTSTPKKSDQQEEIGSLGITIFFVPVAFTILLNVFFFATTIKVINRMHTYGRIHHKLRHSFRMFLMLFLVMTITWLFFMLSFFKMDGLVNAYIIVNAFQGPFLLYVCVFNQKHVLYLIRKTCCYRNCVCKCCEPEPELEYWGDEMAAMNTGIY